MKLTLLAGSAAVLLVAGAVGVLHQRGALSYGGWVQLQEGARQPQASTVPFSRGLKVAGWRVGALRFHAEFVRVTFHRRQLVAAIEINRCQRPDAWCGGTFRVQPAPPRPGHEPPPRALLVQVRDRLAAHGQSWQTYTIQHALHHSSLRSFLHWTLLAPLILLLGGLGAIRLFRTDGRVDRVLLHTAGAADRATRRLRSALRLIAPARRAAEGAHHMLRWLQRVGSTRRGLALLLIPMAWLAFTTFAPVIHGPRVGSDPRVYFEAVSAHQQGVNPYRGDNLQRRSGIKDLGNFTYPPYMLRAFAWMTSHSHKTVSTILAGAKWISSALLLLLWVRVLRCKGPDFVLLLLIAIAGFQYCIRTDMLSGNVSIFEQTALWGGLLAYSTGRRGLFAVLVVLASAAKLHWIGLLVVPVILGDRRGTAMAALGLAGFAGGLALSLGLQPLLGSGFVSSLGNNTLVERGDMNPGTLPVMTDLAALVRGQTYATSLRLGWKLYAIFAAACCLLALPALMTARRAASRIRPVMLTVVLYALLLPQLKDYSYIVLIPPTYYAIRHLGLGLPTRALLLCGACTHLFVYQSWVMLLLLFVTYLLAPLPTSAHQEIRPPDAPVPEVTEHARA